MINKYIDKAHAIYTNSPNGYVAIIAALLMIEDKLYGEKTKDIPPGISEEGEEGTDGAAIDKHKGRRKKS